VVVLQGHLDMVCEKHRDHEHDFARDPIQWIREGNRVRAVGTTLGADNGVGVAAALALMESSGLVHGPLELLFTVDEETGLTGARELEPDILNGKILLNLDSEEEGTIYIGCAGGMYSDLTLDLDTESPPPEAVFFRIRVGGLSGGHSGLNIHEGRANAIRLTSRFLTESAPALGLRLTSMEGGDKHNAIPRECDAVFCVPADRVPALREEVAGTESRFRSEYQEIEGGIFLRLEEEAPPGTNRVLTAPAQECFLGLLLDLPHGVVAMHPTLPDTVETSTNLAAVRCGDGNAEIGTKQRSSSQKGLAETAAGIARIAEQADARVRQGGAYPHWSPDPDSPVLKTARRVYRSLFGREPEVRVIHAGLECGIIGDKVPGMDMLSFGPTIRSAHSPDENVEIDSVSAFWDFLTALLEELSS
jgi:dipeptidase D